MTANINELRDIFDKLEDVLKSEEGGHWFKKIKDINNLISDIESGSLDAKRGVELIRRKYKAMHPSHDGFNEFFVWRDDFKERKKINENFGKLADRAWKILDLV